MPNDYVCTHDHVSCGECQDCGHWLADTCRHFWRLGRCARCDLRDNPQAIAPPGTPRTAIGRRRQYAHRCASHRSPGPVWYDTALWAAALVSEEEYTDAS